MWAPRAHAHRKGSAHHVGASNELGEFESGVTAQWWGAVRAVVAGGIGALAITGIWSVLFPGLRNIDQLTEESLMQVEEEPSSANF
jgi:hypothetical protein